MKNKGLTESLSKYSIHNLENMPFFLTVEEVALLLRTTKKAIYSKIERGQLPGATKIGFRLLIARDDLIQWLNQRRTLSPGSGGR